MQRVTKEMVFKTANQILERGIKPTVEGVRRELGDTGSYSTLTRHLREWRETVGPFEKPGPLPELPDEVLEPVVNVLRQTVGHFEKAANQRILEAKQEADTKLQEAEKELEYANSEIARLESSASENEIETKRKRIEIQDLKITIAKRDERISVLENTLKLVRIQKKEEKDELSRKLDNQQAETTSAKKEVAALSAQLSMLEKERNRVNQQNSELLTALGKTKTSVNRGSGKR